MLKAACDAWDTLHLWVSLLQVNSGRNNRAQHMIRPRIVRTCNIIVVAGLWILLLLELLNILEASKIYSNCLTYKIVHLDCVKKKKKKSGLVLISGGSLTLCRGDKFFCSYQTQLHPQFLLSGTHKEWKWVILALVALQVCLQFYIFKLWWLPIWWSLESK